MPCEESLDTTPLVGMWQVVPCEQYGGNTHQAYKEVLNLSRRQTEGNSSPSTTQADVCSTVLRLRVQSNSSAFTDGFQKLKTLM